jgi:5-formyltetrahydrofolate cyclo-ligase
MTDVTTAADINSQRQAIRQQVRKLRNALSQQQQHQAAQQLTEQMLQLPQVIEATHIALYLSNDAELDTKPLIQALWQAGKHIYLPLLHPFVPGYLIFQRYQQDTPMKLNQFKIPEPVLNCAGLIPVAALDVICTPLVAFDAKGNRLGMGGGFYDRTLSQIPPGQFNQALNPTAKDRQTSLIGLAHQCQQVAQIPVEAWDIPLPLIVTPSQVLRQKVKTVV